MDYSEHPVGWTQARLYTPLAVAFVALLLIANIAATKLFQIPLGSKHLIFDGGAILFPFTYVLGDVLAEIYGFKATRRIIIWGLFASILAAGSFALVQLLPPAPEYVHQESFQAVLGFVPRIVAASLLAYSVGQLLNAYVLVKMKEHWGSSGLWVRLLGSSVVGEAADTLVFATVAFLGTLTGSSFWNYVLVGYVYKMVFEVVLLPLSYGGISILGRVKK